jgi:hypothetical protein
MGGCAGRHGELVLGDTQVVLVDGSFTRKRVGFSDQAGKTVGGGVDTVHQGVGRGWPRVASTLPCRCWCRAGLGSVQVHRNVQRALRALGCTAASTWRGHGDVYGRDRGHLIRGIGQGGLREVSGEAMGRKTVGGVQLRSGALGGDGDGQGGVG